LLNNGMQAVAADAANREKCYRIQRIFQGGPGRLRIMKFGLMIINERSEDRSSSL
jgi:hypothetical protein